MICMVYDLYGMKKYETINPLLDHGEQSAQNL